MNTLAIVRCTLLTLLSLSTFGLLRAEEPAATAPMAPDAQVFVLPANRWTKIAEVPPDPLGRELEPGRGAYACYLPEQAVFMRYGGYTPTECNALWTFDLHARAWTNPLKADYAYPPPADRPGAGPWWSLAYDAKRKVVWMLGGNGAGARTHPELYRELWQYDPAKGTFTKMGAQGAKPGGSPIVYDAKNDLLVRAPDYNGEWSYMHNRDTTWIYDPNTNAWTGKPTKGMPKDCARPVWVYDAASGQCVYHRYESKNTTGETWLFDAAKGSWEALGGDAPQPEGRTCAAAAYDPAHRRVLVYGGVGSPGKDYGYLYRGGGKQLDDTWVLDVSKRAWTRLDSGAPVVPRLNGQGKHPRFELCQTAGYDTKLNAFVVMAPTLGVWALRYAPEGAEALPEAKLAALPPLPQPQPSQEPVYKQAPPNERLVKLKPGEWTELKGGWAGGGEVPATYDEGTGFILKYGGCNDGGTTFASGYGNDLWAYDPATERWLALRYTDPCGPPRPGNGCTRYYAYDPEVRGSWFAGGTAGNNLANSLPPDWKGGNGIWKYDGLRDRFDLVPSTNNARVGAGVVTAYDRTRKLFITSPKAYSDEVFGYSPSQSTWTRLAPGNVGRQYAYATYVDSKQFLLLVCKTTGASGTYALDSSAGAWLDLQPAGDLPDYMKDGRPATAYDPERDAVLLVGGSNAEAKRNDESWVYRVAANRWEKLEVKTPAIAERLVFDRRHKAFVGFTKAGPVAFRLAP
ncbi:MAG: hypothetical protein AMXMBFR7_20070 [Planctomycetota bacterium]